MQHIPQMSDDAAYRTQQLNFIWSPRHEMRNPQEAKMSKQPQPRNRSNPQPKARPVVPNLPSKTGNKSGSLRGNYPPTKSE